MSLDLDGGRRGEMLPPVYGVNQVIDYLPAPIFVVVRASFEHRSWHAAPAHAKTSNSSLGLIGRDDGKPDAAKMAERDPENIRLACIVQVFLV